MLTLRFVCHTLKKISFNFPGILLEIHPAMPSEILLDIYLEILPGIPSKISLMIPPGISLRNLPKSVPRYRTKTSMKIPPKISQWSIFKTSCLIASEIL